MDILKQAALTVLRADGEEAVTVEPTRLDRFLVETLVDAMLTAHPMPECSCGNPMNLVAVTALHSGARLTIAPAARCVNCGSSVASSRTWTSEELEDAAGQPLDAIENSLLELEGEEAVDAGEVE